MDSFTTVMLICNKVFKYGGIAETFLLPEQDLFVGKKSGSLGENEHTGCAKNTGTATFNVRAQICLPGILLTSLTFLKNSICFH